MTEYFEAAIRLAYGHGVRYGELNNECKLLNAKVCELENKVENLKTENAALRKKYEKAREDA